MKVIKPQKLGLLTRTFEHNRQPYLVTTVLAFFGFDSRVLLPEVALWKLAAAELGKDAPLDVGMPKARPELVMTAKGYAPDGVPCPLFAVRAQIGTIDKTLYVIGDRYWSWGAPSDPRPITEMALTWANAFGGPGYRLNPLGKGVAPLKGEGALHPLPNVEDPKRLVTMPGDRPPPAGFGAYDFLWPQRADKLGTYDGAWLKEQYPGFAKDMDLAAFNTAAEDQRLDAPFKEDAPFVLYNLHPQKPLLEGRLPGVTARCFVNQKTGAEEDFKEVPLRLETVHLFPHAERGVLVFRGFCKVEDEDADDVSLIVIGAEEAGAPKPVEHYRRVVAQRLDREKGHLYALRDRDLLPVVDPAAVRTESAPEDPRGMAALLATEGLLDKNMRRRMEAEREKAKEQLREHGLDPDEHMPSLREAEPPPDLDNLDVTIERAMQMAEEKQAEAEEQRKKAIEDARRQCAEQGLDFDKLVEEQQKKAGGPPKFSAKEQLEQLHGMLLLGRNSGVELPHLEAQLADPELERKLLQAEQELRNAYIKFAHHFPPAQALDDDASRTLREELVQQYGAGVSFAGRDLTGADLRGLTLHRADLRGALLEKVNFAGADLRGADLTGAVLARADLSSADLTGAVLTEANFGSANLTDTKIGASDLSRATLAKADLTNTDLRGATLEGADLSEAILAGTDLRDVRAPELNFLSTDLSRAKLAGADLSKCNFLEVNLTGVDLDGATLSAAVFLKVKGDGARFRGATLDKVTMVQECSFANADFTGASLEAANLRANNLAGAVFAEARLSGADLSSANLRQTTFCLATAIDARFHKADLTRADMRSANLMNGILSHSVAHGTDFEGANLFRADLFRMRVDQATRVTHAELGQARFVPERRTDGQA
jgi:uncharacterized protein YjbI with pentapeptide repeats